MSWSESPFAWNRTRLGPQQPLLLLDEIPLGLFRGAELVEAPLSVLPPLAPAFSYETFLDDIIGHGKLVGTVAQRVAVDEIPSPHHPPDTLEVLHGFRHQPAVLVGRKHLAYSLQRIRELEKAIIVAVVLFFIGGIFGLWLMIRILYEL